MCSWQSFKQQGVLIALTVAKGFVIAVVAAVIIIVATAVPQTQHSVAMYTFRCACKERERARRAAKKTLGRGEERLPLSR